MTEGVVTDAPRGMFFFSHSPPLLHQVTLCVAYFYIRCLSTLTVGDNPSYCRIHLRSHAQRAISPCARDIVPHDSCLFFSQFLRCNLLTSYRHQNKSVGPVMRYHHYLASLFHI